ncbi:MAG TPA: hypothetical protein VEM40_13120 [Nitrospirota bacterium]|nr:hypothetical protein [Nitrospirota bacterium]
MTQKKNLHTFVLFSLLLTASILFSCSGGSSESPPPVIPLAPMAVSAVAGDAAVTLGWSAAGSATAYNVYRSVAPGGSRTKIASGVSSTSYRDTGLNNGTPYYYVVTAVSAAGESALSIEVSATPDAVSNPITISGKVQYQDKEYGLNGFTGNQPLKGVRYASIEIVDALGSTVTATTQTDANGLYSISTTTTSTSVYVRVKAEATLSGSTPQIAVKSLSGSIYAVGSDDFIPLGPANVNMSVPTASIGGAFNILDVFTNGFQFVYSLAKSYPPPLSGFWQPGNTNGTYYCPACPQGEGIFILNDTSTGDTDEYDDDVLYHEFGHFMAAHFSQDDSPGGSHDITDNDLDMRLAWSEGWGDSMPGNIKMWLNANAPQLLSSAANVPLTVYVDTVGNNAGVAIDMDSPDGTYGGSYYYACGEVAIAKILLDINKTFGMQDVWAVITNFQANHPTPANLELFWDQWHSLLVTSALSIDSIFLDRLVQYTLDNYEPDNTWQSASVYAFGQPQEHTLYTSPGASDIDYIAFNGQKGNQYTITTTNLLNGADTVITLLNSDGTTTTSGTTPPNPNDNANGTIYAGTTVPSSVYRGTLCDAYGICHDNGFDILGSRLTFTAASTGTYYVRVQSSSARPVSAGRYGTYTLTITTP